MKENIEKRVIGLFFLMLVILVGVAWLAVNTIQKSKEKSDWVNHTHAVLQDAGDISAYLHAGDAFMSAYLLSGAPRDQENYRRNGYNAMLEALDDAKALTRGDRTEEGQHSDFLKLEKLLLQHLAASKALVLAREQGGVEGARQAALAHPEGQFTGDIDGLIANLKKLENGLLSQRDREARKQAQDTTRLIYAGVIVNFALLLFATLLIRDDLNSRRIAATAMAQANAQLEAKVQERTGEPCQEQPIPQKGKPGAPLVLPDSRSPISLQSTDRQCHQRNGLCRQQGPQRQPRQSFRHPFHPMGGAGPHFPIHRARSASPGRRPGQPHPLRLERRPRTPGTPGRHAHQVRRHPPGSIQPRPVAG